MRHRLIALPAGQTPEPFVHLDDLAAVAVQALTTDQWLGRTLELTGPRLLTFEDVVAELTAAVGDAVRYLDCTAEQFVAGATAEGVPEPEARMLAHVFGQVLDGRNAHLSGDLAAVTPLGAGAIGGGPGIFSVMVLSALRRLPADQAVGTMQRINEAALSPPFLGVFLGTAVCSTAVVVHSVVTWGAQGSGPHLAGAGLYLSAVLLTGVPLAGPWPTTSAQSPPSAPPCCWPGRDHAGSHPMKPISLLCTSASSTDGPRASSTPAPACRNPGNQPVR